MLPEGVGTRLPELLLAPTEAERADVAKCLAECVERSAEWTGVIVLGFRAGGMNIGGTDNVAPIAHGLADLIKVADAMAKKQAAEQEGGAE